MQAKMVPSWQSVEDVKHVVEQARQSSGRSSTGHFNEDDYMDGMLPGSTGSTKTDPK